MENSSRHMHFNILALDGAGVRTALVSVVLSRLLEGFPTLLRDVDLIVGASMGGILALSLANERNPSQEIELYIDAGRFIFENPNNECPKYSNSNLEKLLRLEFGNLTFSDLNKRVAVVTFDLDNKLKDAKSRSWKPKIFHNMEKNIDADLDSLVAEVGLSAAATPVYFPSVGSLTDGGLFASNPSLVGIAQALDRRGPKNIELDRINLLSVGTGRYPKYLQGSLNNWSPSFIDMLFDASAKIADFQCAQLLGDSYFRLNPRLNSEISFDSWQKLPELLEYSQDVDLYDALKWLRKNWL